MVGESLSSEAVRVFRSVSGVRDQGPQGGKVKICSSQYGILETRSKRSCMTLRVVSLGMYRG